MQDTGTIITTGVLHILGSMPREVSVRLPDELAAELDARVGMGNRYATRSEAIRFAIRLQILEESENA